MTSKERDIKEEREQAWVGDAVLALVAREWILEQRKEIDASMFHQLTSNQFLNSLGRPTAVEAEIGRLFAEGGHAAAKAYFVEKCVPLYLRQAANRQPWSGKKKFSSVRG